MIKAKIGDFSIEIASISQEALVSEVYTRNNGREVDVKGYVTILCVLYSPSLMSWLREEEVKGKHIFQLFCRDIQEIDKKKFYCGGFTPEGRMKFISTSIEPLIKPR